MAKSILLFFFWAAFTTAQAADPYIQVGRAKTRKTVIAYAPIQALLPPGGDRNGIGTGIRKTVTNDLLFVDLFSFLPESTFLEKPEQAGIEPGSFAFSNWKSLNTEFLIKSKYTVEGKTVTYETFLYDINKEKSILSRKYIGTVNDASVIGHSFANDVIEMLTGLPGLFLTKIAMSCDKTRKKEIYVMDFDGSNPLQITQHRSIAFAPAWSPDGSKIAYSLYTRHNENIKNIDLFEFDFKSNSSRLLSNRKGINSGAAYSPSGDSIALTMSFLGNPEIFLLDARKKSVDQITKSFGFDVDPSWSPDGKSLAFVSSRTGQPMIHRMQSNGEGTQRLTFAGRYNATPNWSMQNNKIAFAGWTTDGDRKGGQFDIFIMNPDGTQIERLTKNQGNNEDPYFSPDGGFIAFSSDRAGAKNIYVMNIDGTFTKRLTYGLGNCVAPKWSNTIKR